METSEGISLTEFKEQAEKIRDEVVQTKFSKLAYDSLSAQKISNEASSDIIQKASDMSKDYKIVCSLITLQKGESGFHMSASCFWDSKSDGTIEKKFEFETFYIVVCLFIISRL